MILTVVPSWIITALQEHHHDLTRATALSIDATIGDYYTVTLHYGAQEVVQLLRCPTEDKDRRDRVKQYSQLDMDIAMKPLHAEIERLTKLLQYKTAEAHRVAAEKLDEMDRNMRRFR